MTNTELTKIREDKKLSKKEFADLIGVTPMLLGRYEKGSCAIPESVAEKLTATEIELKKNTRKAGRKAKEAVEEGTAIAKEAAGDKIVAEEIEAKKTARKAGRKAREAAAAVKKATGTPNIIIQSPMGGIITAEDISAKVPKGTVDVYVRVDENKLYYVLEDGETGDVDIWE